MPSFAEAVAAIHELRELRLIDDYAIGGAVAAIFWTEAIATFDLDVLVLLPPSEGTLVSIGPIYAWAAERGYAAKAEHIVIGEIPVQFVPAHPPLGEEAVREAKALPYSGLSVKVVRPEYLIALWLEPPANTSRRKERAAMLRESANVDEALLADVMARYNLSW